VIGRDLKADSSVCAVEEQMLNMMRESLAAPVSQVRRSKTLSKRLRESLKWYPYLIVNVIVFIIFSLTSWVYVVYLSFNKWDMLGPRKFIWLGNFARMFSDRVLGIALKNTLQYAIMFVPLVSGLSLLIAILVNRPTHMFRTLKSAYFLPNITSIAVLGLIFFRLFSPRTDSPANYLLSLVGVQPQDWLVDIYMALPTLVAISIWQLFGYYMVIWLAGLQGIPVELYDAALVDGASGWQVHWHVTLPLLRPTASFILIIATISSLQVFGSIFILTGGGPVHATTMIVYFIYLQAFHMTRLGYSSAISILLFAIILIWTYLQGRFLHYGAALY